MTVEPASPSNIRYVLDHLWPRGQQELQQLGLTQAQAQVRLQDYAATGVRSGTLIAERPIVITGIASARAGDFTWFQATDEFEQYASAITRFIRRQAQGYARPLSIYSVCVHPDSARWFRVLGFTPDGWEQQLATGATLHRFVKEQSSCA